MMPFMGLVQGGPHPRRLRFLVILPLVWAALCWFGWVYPGADRSLFLTGSLTGIWVFFVVGEPASAENLLLPCMIAGVATSMVLGYLLDRARASLLLWSLFALVGANVAGYILLQGYGDFDQAIASNGSFLAYAACAAQLGGYAATVLVLIGKAFQGVPPRGQEAAWRIG